jgi:GH24 family phage-related lysozyme (muramidase)
VLQQPPARHARFYEAATRLRLEDTDIDDLLNQDIAIKERELRNQPALRDYDNFPAAAQQALLDMAFNLGTAKLTGQFKHLMNFVRERDWEACAEECRVKNIQVERNDMRKSLFRTAAKSADSA